MAYSDPADTAGQFALPRMTTVVKTLLLVNLALALPFLFLYDAVPFLRGVHGALALDVTAWRELAPWLPLWQLVTYGFLHSANEPMHLLGNLIGLYFFGTWLESLLGARRFLGFCPFAADALTRTIVFKMLPKWDCCTLSSFCVPRLSDDRPSPHATICEPSGLATRLVCFCGHRIFAKVSLADSLPGVFDWKAI